MGASIQRQYNNFRWFPFERLCLCVSVQFVSDRRRQYLGEHTMRFKIDRSPSAHNEEISLNICIVICIRLIFNWKWNVSVIAWIDHDWRRNDERMSRQNWSITIYFYAYLHTLEYMSSALIHALKRNQNKFVVFFFLFDWFTDLGSAVEF